MVWNEVKAAQSCLTLWNPMDYTAHGILQARILEWVPFPSPGDLPKPGIKPRSPTLQADSLPTEPQESPRILEWVAYPFTSRSFWPRNQTRVSCIAGWFFTNWTVRWSYLQSRNRGTDNRTNTWMPRGKGGGMNWKIGIDTIYKICN